MALSVTAVHAHADSKAWNAAKAGLPADAQIVIGVDVTAIQQTQTFSALFPKLREKPELAAMFDALKDSCKVDPLTAVQGVVVAMPVDQSDGAVYLSIAGIDRTKLGECMKVASEHDKGPKLTVKQTGNITEMTKDKETSFLGWIGKDVVVVSFHATDKPSLLKWMGGKGALGKSAVGKVLGKVNTSATLWGVVDGDKELQPGITAKRAYGAVTFAKGKLDADLHAVLASAADATTIAGVANQQIADLNKAGAGGGPPQVLAMLKTVKVATANDEVVVKASVVEQDLLAVIAMAMAGGGGGRP